MPTCRSGGSGPTLVAVFGALRSVPSHNWSAPEATGMARSAWSIAGSVASSSSAWRWASRWPAPRRRARSAVRRCGRCGCGTRLRPSHGSRLRRAPQSGRVPVGPRWDGPARLGERRLDGTAGGERPDGIIVEGRLAQGRPVGRRSRARSSARSRAPRPAGTTVPAADRRHPRFGCRALINPRSQWNRQRGALHHRRDQTWWVGLASRAHWRGRCRCRCRRLVRW
jgi:hypothetical protein